MTRPIPGTGNVSTSIPLRLRDPARIVSPCAVAFSQSKAVSPTDVTRLSKTPEAPIAGPLRRVQESEKIPLELVWTTKPADSILRPCRFRDRLCCPCCRVPVGRAPAGGNLFLLPMSFPHSGRAAQPRGRRGYCHPQGGTREEIGRGHFVEAQSVTKPGPKRNQLQPTSYETVRILKCLMMICNRKSNACGPRTKR
jgi:hypothetical protein